MTVFNDIAVGEVPAFTDPAGQIYKTFEDRPVANIFVICVQFGVSLFHERDPEFLRVCAVP